MGGFKKARDQLENILRTLLRSQPIDFELHNQRTHAREELIEGIRNRSHAVLRNRLSVNVVEALAEIGRGRERKRRKLHGARIEHFVIGLGFFSNVNRAIIVQCINVTEIEIIERLFHDLLIQ